MKTTILLVLMVFTYGVCNAQTKQSTEFNEIEVQTYLTKTKLGPNPVNVVVYSDDEFEEICKQLDGRKSVKLGETVFSDVHANVKYLTEEDSKFGFNKVCCRVKNIDSESKKVLFEFNLNCTPGAPSEGNYRIEYMVKEGYNYGISTKFEGRHNILFFISPNEIENLAKIEAWEKY